MAANEKMNISYTIRAIDRFSKVHDKLDRQLSGLNKMAQAFDTTHETTLDANTTKYERKMDSAKKKVDDIPKVKFTRLIVNGWNDFRNRMDRTAQTMRTFDEVSMGMVKGGIFMALPAIVPTLGIVGGGIGAIGSAFTSAGIGAAGFASVAIPAIAGVFDANEKLAEAQKAVDEASDPEERAEALAALTKLQEGYTGAQMESVGAIRDFNKFFTNFAKQFENDILGSFNKSLGTLQTLLTLSEPAISGMVTAADNLIDSLNRNLEAEDMKAFFAWVGETAGPNFEKLVQAVGNFIAGFFNMMTAFDPLAQSFMDGFLNMSERFREWAASLSESQAFQNFMKYVQENTPTLMSLIGNIVTTLVNLAIAMEPIATKVLELADKFFAWTAELVKNNEWIGKVIAVATILRGLLGILWPIVNFGISAFKLVAGAVSLAWGAFNKLWQPISKYVIPIVKKLGVRLLSFAGGPMGILIQIVIAAAIAVAQNWDAIWSKTKEIFSAVGSFIQEKWNQIQAAFEILSALYGMVSDYFGDMKDAVFERMSEIWSDITDIWDEVTSFLEDIDLTQIGKDIMNGLKDGIVEAGKGVVKSVKGVASDAIEGAKNLLGIASPSKVFKQIGVFTGEGMVVGMDRMQSRVTKASERMASASIPSMANTSYQSFNPATAPGGGYNSYNAGSGTPEGTGDSSNTLLVETNKLLRILVNKESDVYLDGDKITKSVNEYNAVDAMFTF